MNYIVSKRISDTLLIACLTVAMSAAMAVETTAGEAAFHTLLPGGVLLRAGIEKDLDSYWGTVRYTNIYGILDVPRIGTEKDKDGKPFKHNAASRGYRHGKEGTELAFKLVGFLDNDERLPTEPYVWIPVDRRRDFWHEGLYVVPLLKIEENVSREGGAVRFKRTRYELLPSRFPLPRIRLADKHRLRKALQEWKDLSELPDGEDTRKRKIAFLKNTLENSCFDSMHACSLRELRQLDAFQEPLTREDATFWCERMLSPRVYRQARQEIADILADDIRNASIRLARYVIHQAAKYSDSGMGVRSPPSSVDKDPDADAPVDHIAQQDPLPTAEEAEQLRNKLSVLMPAFFDALKDSDIKYRAARVLAEVHHDRLRKTLLAWIEDPETRMSAIEMGDVLGDDVEFARRATRYFAECEALKTANDVQGIGRYKDENRWVEMRHVMHYLLVPGNTEGQRIVLNQLESTPPGTSEIRSLISHLIHARDDRFVDSVHRFAENVLQSKGGDRTGELYAALAYLAMWNHPEAANLATRCLKESKPSDYQVRMCKQYLSNVTAELRTYRSFESPQECLEWIKARGERN